MPINKREKFTKRREAAETTQRKTLCGFFPAPLLLGFIDAGRSASLRLCVWFLIFLLQLNFIRGLIELCKKHVTPTAFQIFKGHGFL
jgi:hypothetical protein